MEHFIEKCKLCGAVINQCRCPSKDKEIRYGVCVACAKKKDTYEKDLTKESLMQDLNIKEGESRASGMEKIFCAALVEEGIEVTSRVLKNVVKWRDLMGWSGNAD